jgi:hypothetical protein
MLRGTLTAAVGLRSSPMTPFCLSPGQIRRALRRRGRRRVGQRHRLLQWSMMSHRAQRGLE